METKQDFADSMVEAPENLVLQKIFPSKLEFMVSELALVLFSNVWERADADIVS